MTKKIILGTIILISIGIIFLGNSPIESRKLKGEINEREITLSENKKEEVKDIKSEDSASKKKIAEINKLDEKDLTKIEGIGEVTAEKIKKATPIETESELKDIDGIGEVLTKRIIAFLESEGYKNDKSDKEDKSEKKEKGSNKKITKEELEKLITLIENKIEREREREKQESGKVEGVTDEKIDINKAKAKKLEEINGIGPVYAERIIEKRPFCTVDELLEIKGIGEKTLADVKNQILIEKECVKDEKDVNQETGEDSEKEKHEEEIEELELRLEKRSDDYFETREMLIDSEKSVEKKEEEIENVKRQRDKCIFEKQININKASKEKLIEIEGVGEVTAEKIIENRKNSPIHILEDLKSIDGLGDEKIEKLISLGVCTWKEKAGDESPEDNNEDEEEDDDDKEDEGSNGEDNNQDQKQDKKIKLNSAKKKALEKINGIGPTYAERIIEKRPFCEFEDLLKVKGIGEKTLSEIKNQKIVTIDPPIECLKGEVKIVTDENNIKIKFIDFKDTNYKTLVELKTKKGEPIKDINKTLNLSEEDSIELEEIKKEKVKLKVEVVKKEEKIISKSKDLEINSKEKKDKALKLNEWTFSNQGKSDKDKILLGPHNYKGPYRETVKFSDPESENKEKEYNLTLKVKGQGNIQMGIKRPGYSRATYGKWKNIKEEATLTYTVKKEVRENFNPKGEVVIRHSASDEIAKQSGEVDLTVTEIKLE